MKDIFKAGDIKVHRFVVGDADLAAFGGELVHPVCSTFALAREIEQASRLFIIDSKEAHEEGIGTRLNIVHCSPALPGEELIIESQLEKIEGNELLCTVSVRAGDRVIARGTTGQKVLRRDKLEKIFNDLRKSC